MLSNYLNANKLADDMKAISTAQAMISFSPDGTILHANENFLKTMFCDEAIRTSPDYQRFWSDLAAGRFQSGQFRRLSKAGDDVWIEATYNPVFSGGRVVRILKIGSDITASKIASVHDGNRLRAIDQSQAIIEFETDARSSKPMRIS